MSMENKTFKPKPNVRRIRASPLLKAKVGTGTIDAKKIERAQKVIDHNDVDFTSYALVFLNKIQAATIDYRKGGAADRESLARRRAELAHLVMQIKANAGMFGYPLLSMLAERLLTFLESIEAVDDDVVAIVEACHTTFNLIIANRLKGDSGTYGQELSTELRDAIMRYFTKRASIEGAAHKSIYVIDPSEI